MRSALIFVVVVLVVSGCQTVLSLDTPTDGTAQTPAAESDSEPEEARSDTGLSSTQSAVVAAAMELMETQSTVVGDVTYSYDCSGTILTAYARAGIYLVDLFSKYTGNGVARLYGIASDHHLLHDRVLPQPGDLVFWDNTYDRNGDGEWNDPLTHAGLVLSVSDNGTVEYVHHNYRRGIVSATMNLLAPDTYVDDDGVRRNSAMRMASQRDTNPDLWLASHLFREFASMHEIVMAMTTASPAVASAQ